MYKVNLLFTFLFIALTVQISTAQKFLAETFTEVTVAENVVYGTNTTVIQAPTIVSQPLTMDIYEPVGDDATVRPLALVFHTGNFLPLGFNGGITGEKKDSSVVEICTRLAKMGYTAAAVTYRQGWNPLSTDQSVRTLTLLQAAYRGIQDGRNAVRFFRNDVANGGNTYSVDETRIVAIGQGTGGYITLGMATLDDYQEIINANNGNASDFGKFFFDPDGSGPSPEIPMVLEEVHGDINGEVEVTADGSFPPYSAGDISNQSNLPGFSSDIDLCMHVGGALGDITWLDENSAPIISVQSAYDPFAPYGSADVIVPTTGQAVVKAQGGKEVAIKQNDLGSNQVFIDAGLENEVLTIEAAEHSAAAGHPFYEALYPVTNPLNSSGNDEGVVIEWWDPNATTPDLGFGNLTWATHPHPSDQTGMTSFHQDGLVYNEGMSAEKARLNIDTVLGFYAPRAYVALDLSALAVSNENLEESEVSLVIAPNPVGNEVVLTSDADNPMQTVQVFDINGRMVRDYQNVNNNYFFMTRGNLPTGTYIVMIGFEDGEVSKKLMLD